MGTIMAKFFKYFPNVAYTLNDITLENAKNILSKVAFEKNFRENSVLYYEYLVEDGDTPDIVAHKIYGSSENHWIILMLNELMHPQFDWPLDSHSLSKYIDAKYQQVEYANNFTEGAGTTWAQTNIKEYRLIEIKTNELLNDEISVEKFNITSNAYANTVSTTSNYTLQDGTPISVKTTKETISYYDYEIEQNENKRSIKILKPEFVPSVEDELIRAFK
jgi:hypothetical protein